MKGEMCGTHRVVLSWGTEKDPKTFNIVACDPRCPHWKPGVK